jgi:hypothetical protein
VAGVERAGAAAVGVARAEGGGGDQAGDEVILVAVPEVGEEAEHGGCTVALGEPAAEAWGGDDAAPPAAHGGGTDEARGVVRRQAEEDLLDELAQPISAFAMLLAWPDPEGSPAAARGFGDRAGAVKCGSDSGWAEREAAALFMWGPGGSGTTHL